MNNRLPVYIEDNELPIDDDKKENINNNNSYGYVNILYLISLIITLGSFLTVLILGK